MARLRVREKEATDIRPHQSIAGYYPQKWKVQPANINRKNVTAEEILAALANEPGAPDADMRVYTYGAHEKYRASHEPDKAGVLASVGRRSALVDEMRAIQADRDAYRAELELAAAQRFGVSPPVQIASMLKREINTSVAKYEQQAIVDFMSDQMGHKYTRVLGVWISS